MHVMCEEAARLGRRGGHERGLQRATDKLPSSKVCLDMKEQLKFRE
jgi:hypothetical protein